MPRKPRLSEASSAAVTVADSECLPLIKTNKECVACRNQQTANPNLILYRFPSDPGRRKRWLINCGRQDLMNKEDTGGLLLCNRHFESNQFCEDRKQLVNGAVPTVFAHTGLAASNKKSPLTITITKCQNISDDGSGSGNSAAPTYTVGEGRDSGELASVTSGLLELANRVPEANTSANRQPGRTSVRETPLQKYMIMCTELKAELKEVQKDVGVLDKIRTGSMNLLQKQIELLPLEEMLLLTGSLLQQLEDAYKSEPRNQTEVALKSLWEKHVAKNCRNRPLKRPVAEIAVFVLCKKKTESVIIGKRKSKLGGGLFHVPGGEIEFGETWEEAAVREVAESTGLQIKDVEVCSIVDTLEQKYEYHSVTVFMKGNVDNQKKINPYVVQPFKCDDWHWCKWSDLPEPSRLFWPLRDFKTQELDVFN